MTPAISVDGVSGTAVEPAGTGVPGDGLRALLRRQSAGGPAREAGARAGGRDAAEPAEHCDLCAERVPEGHRHLLDMQHGTVLCACGPCALLFAHSTAGGRHYKLLPDRRVPLRGFRIDAMLWARLGVPVGLAFFVRDGATGEVRVGYPSPLGVTRSVVGPEVWEEVARGYPELAELADDVEALLVHRTDGPEGPDGPDGPARTDSGDGPDGRAGPRDAPGAPPSAPAGGRHWIVPLDDCYRLAAVVRTHWRGLSGGPEVREHIDAFFAGLGGASRTADETRSQHG